jgi:hypothetical protein
MNTDNRLPLALLLMRLSVFAVLLVWTVDKFVRPEHAAAVFRNFYLIGGLGDRVFTVIGILEVVLIAGFVVGFRKRLTYGAVFILHGISTLSSYKQYLAPFEDPNLLFFAAWPMWAACFALYALRDRDTLWSVSRAGVR